MSQGHAFTFAVVYRLCFAKLTQTINLNTHWAIFFATMNRELTSNNNLCLLLFGTRLCD